MSCWVAPSIAAELWGIPVAQVLDQIRQGLIPTRDELGFTLVDAVPAHLPLSKPSAPGHRPATFKSIAIPLGASAETPEAGEMHEPAPAPAPSPALEDRPAADEEDAPIGDWRQVRLQMSRQRRRPAPAPARALAV